MTTTSDPRVAAIRADDLIGRGTCSVVDECWTDDEIIAMLDARYVKTPERAVKEMLFTHEVWTDKADEIRRA